MKKYAFLLLLMTSIFTACEVNKPVTISKFSTEYSTYYVDETINFVNESVAANSFLWEFGDDRTSTRQNVSISYDKPGRYEITLHAYGTYNDDVSYLTIEVIQSTDLDVLVLYYDTGNADLDPPVFDAKITLYASENDYLNFQNAVLSGYTDEDGLIFFRDLNPAKYWIDAYLPDNNGGYYSNELSGSVTDPLVEDQINYYTVFVEFFSQTTKDGKKCERNCKIKKIQPADYKTIKNRMYRNQPASSKRK